MKRIEVAFGGHLDGDQSYGDSASAASVGSSPRSVGAGKGSVSEEPLPTKWDDMAFIRVKLMCSYGGKILPRPHDNQLRYVGGETRIVVVNRNISYGELTAKLFKLFGACPTIKYQLPSEDLDALISVTSDEDLENMMEEYDRLQASNRTSRLRLFLFPRKLDSQTSLSDLLESNRNREHWFVDALNGMPILPRMRSETSSIISETPDYLFGLEALDEWPSATHPTSIPADQQQQQFQVAAEKPAAALLASLLPASGEISSAPASPLKRMHPTQSASSAPPSISAMLSAVVDAALKGNPMKQAAPAMPMDEHPFDTNHGVLVQERGSSERQMGEENSGSASKQQQYWPDQRPGNDDVIQKPSKFSHDQQLQAVEFNSTARPLSNAYAGLNPLPFDGPPKSQPAESLQPAKMNPANQDAYTYKHENAAAADVLNSETKQESPRMYVRLVSKPEESKTVGAVSSQGGTRKVAEDRGETLADHVKDQKAPRKQAESAETFEKERSQSFEKHLDGMDPAETRSAAQHAEEIHQRDPSFMVSLEAAAAAASEQDDSSTCSPQQQLKLGPNYQLQSAASEVSPITYATQPPAIQLPSPSCSAASSSPPAVLKGVVVPSRMSPSRTPPSQPRLNVTTAAPTGPAAAAVYSSSSSSSSAGVMHSPASHLVQLQRQASDPVLQQQFQRVTSPHRDHQYAAASPAAAILPSRFRGRPVGPNVVQLGPDKRVAMRQAPAAAAQQQPPPPPPAAAATASRPPLPPQYIEQLNYPVGVPLAYDPAATYAIYGHNLAPSTTDAHYAAAAAAVGGVNPFMDDFRPPPPPPPDVSSSATSAAAAGINVRYQDHVFDVPADLPSQHGAGDGGRLQGRQFILRN